MCPLQTGKYMAGTSIIAPMPFERLPFDAETHLADVQMFQQEAFGAIYLIDDDRKAIVETGTSWDANRILEAVRSFGLKPADIDALVVSHIHLDHAGGAGRLRHDAGHPTGSARTGERRRPPGPREA